MTIGDAIGDTATLSGAHDPSGTITFSVYGADDATCTEAPLATSTVAVDGNGSFAAEGFIPAARYLPLGCRLLGRRGKRTASGHLWRTR